MNSTVARAGSKIGAREVGDSSFTYVAPLQELTAVPYSQYSHEAGDAETLDGQDSSDFVTHESDPTVREDVKDGVEWSEISHIPAGIGDPESDPTVQSDVKDGVHWDELSGIPDGFADGVDHGITGETDPTVIESVKDGVDWLEISNIPPGFSRWCR